MIRTKSKPQPSQPPSQSLRRNVLRVIVHNDGTAGEPQFTYSGAADCPTAAPYWLRFLTKSLVERYRYSSECRTTVQDIMIPRRTLSTPDFDICLVGLKLSRAARREGPRMIPAPRRELGCRRRDPLMALSSNIGARCWRGALPAACTHDRPLSSSYMQRRPSQGTAVREWSYTSISVSRPSSGQYQSRFCTYHVYSRASSASRTLCGR